MTLVYDVAWYWMLNLVWSGLVLSCSGLSCPVLSDENVRDSQTDWQIAVMVSSPMHCVFVLRRLHSLTPAYCCNCNCSQPKCNNSSTWCWIGHYSLSSQRVSTAVSASLEGIYRDFLWSLFPPYSALKSLFSCALLRCAVLCRAPSICNCSESCTKWRELKMTSLSPCRAEEVKWCQWLMLSPLQHYCTRKMNV